MNSLNIKQVKTKEERRKFLSFPWKVYQDNPYWVPPLLSERMDFTDPEENPFFQHAEMDFYLALRGEDVVGTIAVFVNHRHNEFQNEHIAFFGFFEVMDDVEAAQKLLRTAEDWARERGYDALRGPAQFSTNDECALLVDGFDDRPRVLMTYNPPYYVDLLEGAGYEIAMTLWAYALGTRAFMDNVGERIERLVDRIKTKKNLTVRKIDMKNFRAEVER